MSIFVENAASPRHVNILPVSREHATPSGVASGIWRKQPSDLQGSDVSIAEALQKELYARFEGAIFVEGAIWVFGPDFRCWERLTEASISRAIQRLNGCTVSNSNKGLSLSAQRVASSRKLLQDRMTPSLALSEEFFTPPSGFNIPAENGVVVVDEDGTTHLDAFCPDQRLRRRGVGRFNPDAAVQPPADSLFGRFLDRLLRGSAEREALLRLLQQMFGVALSGGSTRLKQPRAFFLTGTANSGKSTLLRILTGMFPPSPKCIGSFSIADMSSDQGRHIPQLRGILCNLCDERPDERELRTEVFKGLVDGGTKRGREVAQPAVEVKGQAIHIFTSNALPEFKCGVDGGLQRRLAIVPFEGEPIAEGEVIEGLGQRIAKDEADLVLRWAVAGLVDVMQNGGVYAIPTVSKTALLEAVGDNAVAAWAFTRLASDPDNRLFTAELYKSFLVWGRDHGYHGTALPNTPSAFAKRLREFFQSPASHVKKAVSSKGLVTPTIKLVKGYSMTYGVKLTVRESDDD